MRSPRRARSCEQPSRTPQCPLRVAWGLCIPRATVAAWSVPALRIPASDRVGGCRLCLSGSTVLFQTARKGLPGIHSGSGFAPVK